MPNAVRIRPAATAGDSPVPPAPPPVPSDFEGILPEVYRDLRSLAARALRRERSDHTLQPSALVNEVYLRLYGGPGADTGHWQSRAHFFGAAALAIRRILVEHARHRAARKRGGGSGRRIPLDAMDSAPVCRGDVDVLELEGALEALGQLDPRLLHVAQLRLYGGLTMDEIALVSGRAKRTIEQDWALARAWLRRELRGGEASM